MALGSFYSRGPRGSAPYEPRIATGAAREETRWALYKSWVRWPLGRTAFREFQVPERSGRTTIVTPRFVRHVHRAGLPVKVWTVNDRADIDRLLAWGVDAIISDRPDVAVAVVQPPTVVAAPACSGDFAQSAGKLASLLLLSPAVRDFDDVGAARAAAS